MKKEKNKDSAKEMPTLPPPPETKGKIAKRPLFLGIIIGVGVLGLVTWGVIALVSSRAKIDETPPIISTVSISSVTDSTAVISWTTDEPATSQLSYRQLDSQETVLTPESPETFVTKHSVTLRDLRPDTVYWLNVVSKDASGNRANHEAGTIKTLSTTPTGPEVGNKVGNAAPDFTLTALDGKSITLNDFRGKIVILNFWIYGCSACAEEMSQLQSIYDKWSRDKLAILAVNVRTDPEHVKYFAEKRGLTFPIPLDSQAKIIKLYYPQLEFPIAFIIDAKGIIRQIKEGLFDSEEEIENILKSL